MKFIIYILAFVVIPVVEVWLFLQVQKGIGIVWLLIIMVLMSAGGIFLFRFIGHKAIWEIWDDMDKGKVPFKKTLNRFFMLIGSILIIVPGFFTACAGLILMLPPVQIFLRSQLLNWIEKHLQSNLEPEAYEARYDHDTIIDVDYKRLD